MKVACLLSLVMLPAALARADGVLPIAEGTTWQYESVEELGGPAAAPPSTTSVTVRTGRQNFGGKEFIKLETTVDDVVTRTELMTLDERGWVCHFRAGKDGRMAKLDPPQTIIPGTIKAGDSWDSDGELAGMEMRQHFVVANEESVTVAAGTFRAFRIHCEDSSIMSAKLDRWFFPGVGFVKETTVVRGPTGGLLQRSNLELQKRPEVIARPEPTSTPVPAPTAAPSATPQIRGPSIETDPAQAGKKLTVEVSTDPAGGSKTEFKSDVQNIYVRWHGHGLPEGAKVRVAWIAEDVGDLVEPNFVVDETESVAPAPDASARFTLGRPPDGWAEGKYRVEFYINDELEETVRVTIVK
jgi:predicted Rdx family selenoprotein